MTNTKNISDVNQKLHRHNLTLSQYVHRRNGVPLGAPKSLRNMLYRAFGASSFAKFWLYWNPIWGYGLGKFVYAPLQKVISPTLALIMTFVISGGIHDLATMAVRRSVTFFFTPWFFLLSIGVLLGRFTKMDLSDYAWWVRVGVNLIYLSICMALTILVKRTFNIP
jgi:hypothetical protein